MLSSVIWFVEFSLLGNCYLVQRRLADPPTKTSAVWLVDFSCATLTKSLKETVADPAWVQSTIGSTYGMR